MVITLLHSRMFQGQSTPWSRILTSMPVWAIVLAHFAENWGFYTLLTTLPMFLSDVFGFDLDLVNLIAKIMLSGMPAVIV